MMISINNQSKTTYNSNKIIRLEIYKSEVFHSYINTKNLLNDHINISPKNVLQFKSNQHTKYFT